MVARRPRVFPSLMDWLDPQVPIEWLADFLCIIRETPNLTWLLLTKRPELFRERLQRVAASRSSVTGCTFAEDWLAGGIPRNIWIGATVEDQKRADERIPYLLEEIPAEVLWLSIEPLLEDIDLSDTGMVDHSPDPDDFSCGVSGLVDWIVVGGESGSKRRDCGVGPIISVVKQCKAYDVPVWVKQDCALRPGTQGRIPDDIWALKQLPKT